MNHDRQTRGAGTVLLRINEELVTEVLRRKRELAKLIPDEVRIELDKPSAKDL